MKIIPRLLRWIHKRTSWSIILIIRSPRSMKAESDYFHARFTASHDAKYVSTKGTFPYPEEKEVNES